MRKYLGNILWMLFTCTLLFAQQKEVKNVIVMIPDGVSMPVIPISRWYNDGKILNLESYVCGMVRTHSSNAPIGDSAPTGSTYATGELSQAGYVATYPPQNENDLFPERGRKYDAYQPLFTVLEAAKLANKSTGLVATSQFTHATPADFSAHTPNRGKEYIIAKQIVHNNVDVVFSGGQKYLYKSRDDNQDLRTVLQQRGVEYTEDITEMKDLKGPKAWALFADADLEYDIMRDPAKEPSIEEMTKKAIELLSQNDNGFFLMVEGSKVDWAAHAHNTKCVITDFLAFDKAVGAAIDFAERDGNTAVIILPDHGNGGLNINSKLTAPQYGTLPLNTMLEPLKKCLAPQQYGTLALDVALEEKALENSFPMFCEAAEQTLTKPLSDREKEELERSYAKIDSIVKEKPDSLSKASSYKNRISDQFVKILNERSYFGWIAGGHTGEDVFLSVYHPNNYLPKGIIFNIELNGYIQEIMGVPSLETLTREYFSPLSSGSLKEGDFVDLTQEEYPVLTIKKGKETYLLPAYTNTVYTKKRKKSILNRELSSVIVYVKENKTFYIPETLKKELGY